MLTTVTLDDATGSPVTLHATPPTTRRLQRASGLVGISTPRAVVRSRPTAHGAIDQTHWTGERLIALEGLITGTDDAAALADFRAVEQALLQTLDDGPALLKWTEAGAGGLALQALVRLADEVMPNLEPGPSLLRYLLQLRAEDPRAYSQSLTTATGGTIGTSSGGDVFGDIFPDTFSPGAGGTVAINNLGNRPTPPVFRFYGGATNARISLVGTSSQIALTGNIAAGDYLEIDVQARTLKLNGTSNALYLLDAANTTWFELPAGTSTIRAFAVSFDLSARCDVLFRSAYA